MKQALTEEEGQGLGGRRARKKCEERNGLLLVSATLAYELSHHFESVEQEVWRLTNQELNSVFQLLFNLKSSVYKNILFNKYKTTLQLKTRKVSNSLKVQLCHLLL